MSDQATDDPRAQIRRLYAEARQAFARDVDAILAEAKVFAASLEHAIGEVSATDALTSLRRIVLEKFDERLPMTPARDPQLLRLVRDASRLLNEDTDELSWGGDVKDWNEAAAPYLDADDPRRI
jgi:hypothetical protein